MSRFESAVTVVLTIAIAAVAIVQVRREFFPAPPAARPPPPPPVLVDGWERIVPAGAMLGDATASVKIIVFSDLQCPNCRNNHALLRRLSAEHESAMAVVFVHFPLSNHELAFPAATAAECARAGAKLDVFLDVMYPKQDSLGLKSWGSYAWEAGLRDTVAFSSCMQDSVTVAAVQAGIAIGRQFGIEYTPTVLVNGWKFIGTPPESAINELVTALRKDPRATPRGVARR